MKEKPLVLHIDIPGDHSVGIFDVTGTITIDDNIPRNEAELNDLKEILGSYYDCPPGCFMTDDEWESELQKRRNEETR